MIETICGVRVFESLHALRAENYLLKKQTRKFKNKRWNKKYRKRYTATRMVPCGYMDNLNNCFYIHPSLASALAKYTERTVDNVFIKY